MHTSLRPILCDTLVRFQRAVLRETGRRPMAFSRTPMEEALLLPGCTLPGYVFWQPAPWPEGMPAPGSKAGVFHQSIWAYLSVCQFLEIPFCLPVAPKGSPLSFLYGRIFETCPNTLSHPPARALEEAFLYQREHPSQPLAFCMAQTSDAGEPLLLMLRAADGRAYIQSALDDQRILNLNVGLDRLLPKLQFTW